MKKTIKNKIQSFPLEEIDELKFICFIVVSKLEETIKNRIMELGGRVLSAVSALGVSRQSFVLNALAQYEDCFLILAEARKEEAKNIVNAIAVEFNFFDSGSGKAFVVDIEGYMGAKGPYAEVYYERTKK